MSGHAVHIKLDGRTYSGTYKVDRKILTVTTSYGKKSAEIGHRVAHETLAHQTPAGTCPRGKVAQGLDALTNGWSPPLRHTSLSYDLDVGFNKRDGTGLLYRIGGPHGEPDS